jgi:septum formation protein
VRPSSVIEWPYRGGGPAEYARALARAKAGSVHGDVVVGADTIVVLDGLVLGKPHEPDTAASMLRLLSGRTHEVVTAVAVRRLDEVRCEHARSQVTFRHLSDREIGDYVATGEPLDKAGAYAYQGGARDFVTELVGEEDAVIGLPLSVLARLLPAQRSPFS